MTSNNQQKPVLEHAGLDENDLDAVRGGEKLTCTVDKVTTLFGWTFAHATCSNGMGINVIQPPAK